jgi:hypothetical protein
MKRILLATLLIVFVHSGCSEPDQPRFVPASSDEKVTSSADRKDPGQVTIPKNIEMH